MVQIIRPPQRESFSSQLGLSLGQGLSGGVNQAIQDKMQREASKAREEAEMRKLTFENDLKKEIETTKGEFGLKNAQIGAESRIKSAELSSQASVQAANIAAMSRVQAAKVAAEQKGKEFSQKHAIEMFEKIQPLENALATVNEMKNIREEGSLGFGSGYSPYASTREKAGKYAQLGKSLIPFATSGVVIRNKTEFEEYAELLTDPSISDARAKGALEAMEKIITDNLNVYSGEEISGERRSQGSDLTSKSSNEKSKAANFWK